MRGLSGGQIYAKGLVTATGGSRAGLANLPQASVRFAGRPLALVRQVWVTSHDERPLPQYAVGLVCSFAGMYAFMSPVPGQHPMCCTCWGPATPTGTDELDSRRPPDPPA